MTVNIPAPESSAWIVGITELAGGVLLALGTGAGRFSLDARRRIPRGFERT